MMVRSALGLVQNEVSELLDRVDSDALDRLADALWDRGRRWFLTGQGRSGLVARCSAMRLMHLGHRVHVVGEATAPAIEAADGLLVFSASGETVTTRGFVSVATRIGATVVVLTAAPGSTLARQADFVLEIPARSTTQQFGGSLFEQGALLVMDAVALALSGGSSEVYLAMQHRHANLQ
jgi:6-phospho-3-hexuloisomerase